MPRKPDIENVHNLKWNFYVNPIEKAEYLIALTKSGKARCQSAGIRAFMYLYAQDEELRTKVNSVIDNFIVYKENGDMSQM